MFIQLLNHQDLGKHMKHTGVLQTRTCMCVPIHVFHPQA